MADPTGASGNRPPRPGRTTDMSTGQTTNQGGGANDELVERITASLAEMFARALRQSVEHAVEQAMRERPREAPGPAAERAVHTAQAQKPAQ